LTYPSGDVYRGDWDEGLKSGKGEYIFANGDRQFSLAFVCFGRNLICKSTEYSGEWHEGFATGQGVLTTSHLTYTGAWLEDKVTAF